VVSAPPLRRRKEDIPALVNHFLTSSQHSYLNRGRTVSEDAMKALMKYDWPGNIRELQNACERLQILSDGHTIMLNDILRISELLNKKKISSSTTRQSLFMI